MQNKSFFIPILFPTTRDIIFWNLIQGVMVYVNNVERGQPEIYVVLEEAQVGIRIRESYNLDIDRLSMYQESMGLLDIELSVPPQYGVVSYQNPFPENILVFRNAQIINVKLEQVKFVFEFCLDEYQRLIIYSVQMVTKLGNKICVHDIIFHVYLVLCDHFQTKHHLLLSCLV